MNANRNAPERAATALFCRATVVDESVSDETRSVDVIVSSDAIDGHGTIVKQNWKLERFAANPVVLYGHNHYELPIGQASNVGVVDGQLRATITFSTEDLNAEAEKIWRNVRAKVIRGISAGFMPHSITFEKQNDREVMVLDDNELFEISVTPCPSNADALMQMRSMHEAQPQTPPAPEVTAQPPETLGKESNMAENNDTGMTMTVARALALPVGCTEHDVLTRVVQLRETDSAVIALTGAKSGAEAVGALRAMKESAERLKSVEEKLAKVEAERDVQNFETLVQQAKADRKIVLATEKVARDAFARACAEGRGASEVENFRGWVNAAPPITGAPRHQPEVRGGGAAPELTHNGKKYGELKPAQRARLANEDPDLYRAMRTDHEEAARA